jgi:hypothetical protein
VFDILTGNTILMMYIGLVLVMCFYLMCLFMTAGLECGPGVFNARGQVTEAFGRLVRQRKLLPSVPGQVDPMQFFKLNPTTATAEDVELAAETMFDDLFYSHPWAYPASQKRLLNRHIRKARGIIAIRADQEYMASTEAERERRRIERAQAHRATQQGTVPGPEQARRSTRAPVRPVPATTGWRRVLGLSNVEQDQSVIKKAYRQRVSAAHPDRGGNTEATAELNDAFAKARNELSFV